MRKVKRRGRVLGRVESITESKASGSGRVQYLIKTTMGPGGPIKLGDPIRLIQMLYYGKRGASWKHAHDFIYLGPFNLRTPGKSVQGAPWLIHQR